MRNTLSPFEADDTDEGVEIDLTPSRKITGSDESPLDEETGETLFDDLTPRLRTFTGDADEDEEQDEDEPAEDEEQDEPSPEPGDDESEDEDEDEEPTDDELPPKRGGWRRRLERANRLREEAEANHRDTKARLDRLEATLTSRASEEDFTKETAALEAKRDEIRLKLRDATEKGLTDDQVKYTEELQDVLSDLKIKKIEHERAKDAAKERDTGPTNTVVQRKVSQWMRKHPRFRTDNLFATFVRAADRQVAAQQYDPESDEYYKQLDKLVRERYPEEYKGERKVKRNKSPTANFSRGGDGSRRPTKDFEVKGGKVRLTPRQVQNMRTFGLDPANPKDVREYVVSNRK